MLNELMHDYGAEPSAIREQYLYGLARKAEIGENNVFDFSIGNPSVPMPAQITEALLEGAQLPSEQIHSYTPAQGTPAARQAVADVLNQRYNQNYTADNFYLTCGAAAAISISLKAIIQPDDEVIVNTPYFPEYAVWIKSHGAQQVNVPARVPDFQLDVPAIEAAITKHTKAVIINTPNNPVGVIYTPEILAQLADVLRAKSAEFGRPIFLLSDEPYRELAYGPVAPAWIPSIYEYTLVCYSWSKAWSLPGERIGYVLVPNTMPQAERVMYAIGGAGRALGFVNAPSLFQYMVSKCAGVPADIETYQTNRKLICEVMDEAGLEYVAPDGAFYLWVKSLEEDEAAFAERAKAHEVLLVPSDSFGVSGWVRFGYCVAPEVITGALPALKALVAEYR